MSYEHIVVEWRSAHVAEVRMNRPEKRNAMNMKLWQEVGHVFGVYLQHHPKCRAILLTGAGSVFSAGKRKLYRWWCADRKLFEAYHSTCLFNIKAWWLQEPCLNPTIIFIDVHSSLFLLHFSGIDLSSSFVSNLQNDDGEDDGVEWDGAHSAAKILRDGGAWQQAWLAINRCNKPVIACIQRGCFGAALEMIAYTDIRFCTADTVFQAPEVDIGLAADIGGNQMLPKIIGNDSLSVCCASS